MTNGAARLALVLDVARDVTARRRLDDVLGATFRSLHKVLAFSGGSIQLLDDDGWIRMAASDPIAPAHVMQARIPLGSTVGGRIILTEAPVYLPDIQTDTAVPADRGQAAVSRGVRAYLGVPLLADGRAIGVLQIDSTEADPWSEEDRLLLSSVAPIVAAAIQNARAHNLRAAAFRRLAQADQRQDAVRSIVHEELAPLAEALQSLGAVRDNDPGDPAVLRARLRAATAEGRRLAEICTRLAEILAPDQAEQPTVLKAEVTTTPGAAAGVPPPPRSGAAGGTEVPADEAAQTVVRLPRPAPHVAG